MSTFVEVPEEAFRAFEKKGFTADRSGNELVYRRTSTENPGLTILVYTSVAIGATVARGCGKDAVRVVLVGFMGTRPDGSSRGERGLFTQKVLRVTSVEGVLNRAWNACYHAALGGQKYGGPCPHCGAITYADSKRCTVPECRRAHAPSSEKAVACG